NFNEEELKTTINEISEALIDNTEFIDLNFYDNNEVKNNLLLNNQQQLETEEYSDSNLNLEPLFDENFKIK
ncbi:9459_t:CDS:2, partial [Dentiscutata heterogama]